MQQKIIVCNIFHTTRSIYTNRLILLSKLFCDPLYPRNRCFLSIVKSLSRHRTCPFLPNKINQATQYQIEWEDQNRERERERERERSCTSNVKECVVHILVLYFIHSFTEIFKMADKPTYANYFGLKKRCCLA